MGFFAGEAADLLAAGEDNPDGFWERNDVVRANKKILRQCNCRWDMVSSFRAERVAAAPRRLLLRRAGDVVAALGPHAPWFIKDPRMCLLLPLWLPVMKDPVCLIVARNPAGVADSLNRRNGIPLEVGAALWELYMIRALEYSAGRQRAIVSFDRIAGNPQAGASSVFDGLKAAGCHGLALPDEAGITACFGPRPAGTAAAGRGAVGLTREQQFLWDALSEGKAPGGPAQAVSPRAVRVLKSYEKAVIAAMPPGERGKRLLRSFARRLGLPWDCSGG